MMDWIAQNHQILGLALNFAMLVVWIAYLQVFVSSYRRQIRANILINMGAGSGLLARCLVSNMSSDAVYIYSIIIKLELPERILTCSVTETDGLENWEKPTDLNLWTRQGPLQAGEVRDMGAFDVMIDHALRSETGGTATIADLWEAIRGFTVRIIAVYGSEDLPVAAERRFAILRRDNGLVLWPSTAEAHQVRSRRKRRKIRHDLGADLARPGA